MTEDQIERIVERKMDALDRKFLNTPMTQAEYDRAVSDLNRWALGQWLDRRGA